MSAIIPGLVSTIIPAYNRPRMLVEATESVLAQSYRPIEIILVNDGSTDDTGKIAEELARKHPEIVSVIHKKNSGAGPSREAGRLVAQGEFIQYLDSDDLLCSEKFRLQVEALRRAPSAGVAYGWIQLQDEDGVVLPKPYKKSAEVREALFPWILADRWWNTNAPLWRRTLTDQMGPWSSLRWSQDWEYDARAGALRAKLVHVPAFVTIQRQHGGNRQTTAADWMRPDRIQNRSDLLQALWAHAKAAGVPQDEPHRLHFARWAFAIARNAARAGMTAIAVDLLAIAQEAAAENGQAQRGIVPFRKLGSMVGYRVAGQIFHWIARWRSNGDLTIRESFGAD
jgi:hypothetical protein